MDTVKNNILFVLCFILFALRTRGFLFDTQETYPDKNANSVKWDGLKVRFGLLHSRNFRSQPRTASDAEGQGYTKISDCETSLAWRGNRYVKNNDLSLILLYDVNGYIAGIQTGVPEGSGYPSSRLQPPFVFDADFKIYLLTAYFVDPDTICDTGRNAAAFEADGTGTNLYIQNGSSPGSDSVLIPREESALAGTGWGRGKCFYSMGVHYWFELSREKPCDTIFPAFLLYHQGTLKAFGWAMVSNIPSPSLEHVVWPVFPFFMTPVPKCLATSGVVSSQHIYMVDNVQDIKCKGERFKPIPRIS